MKFLVLDAGSSFLKAAVADSESLALAQVCRSAAIPRLPHADPAIYEIDADQLVATARRLIAPLVRDVPVAGLLICGQMGGLIFADECGRPQSPWISWQDQRTRGTTWPQLTAQLGSQVTTVLGNEWKPGLTLPLLYHLRQQGECPPGVACGLPDFLVAALTASRPQLERTSATGLLSVATGQLADLLADIGVLPAECWPAVVDFSLVRGQTTIAGRTIPVYGGTGDHQTALVGAMLQHEELSINVATGSQMSMLVEQPELPHRRGQLRPFFDQSWLATVTNIPAGRALSAVLKLLTELSPEPANDQQWEQFLKAAESVSQTDVRAGLGFFAGAVPMPGRLTGLTEETLSVAHVAHACLQSMAAQYGDLQSELAAGPPQQLVFSGGVARKSALLRRLICAQLSASRVDPPEQGDERASQMASPMPSRMVSAEDTLLGLAILGKVISGECESVRQAIDTARRQQRQ